ncbi:MAG TPA: ATP-binding cassette domain-containing protein [Gammaproteobacteria bacterium]|nr:ATP-binding cassette domain-containing protein [Gammaproteobacteria bacterium]
MNTAPVLFADNLVPLLPGGGASTAQRLTLELPRGRLACLVGPQGAGKTLYLRALAAVDPPATGRLVLNGRDTERLGRDAWRVLRCEVAFVGHSAPLLSVVDGLMNVMLPALYHGLGTPAAMRDKALAILERLGWEGDLTVLPAFLDEHQRRLLALARCLILDPVLLFIDEPFRMTDTVTWKRLAAVFVDLVRNDGLTIIAVTHQLSFVREHADLVLFIDARGVRRYESWRDFAWDEDAGVKSFLEAAGYHIATVT